MKLNKNQWIGIAVAAVILIVLFKGEGFLGAALSLGDESLCTDTGGTIAEKAAPYSQTYSLSATEWNDFVLIAEGEYNASKLFKPIIDQIGEIQTYDCASGSWNFYDPTTDTVDLMVGANEAYIVQIQTLEDTTFTTDKVVEAGACKVDKGTNTSCVFAKYFDSAESCPIAPTGFETYCDCPVDTNWISGYGCIAAADLEETLCTSTGGSWDATAKLCTCPVQTKFNEEQGCLDCMQTNTYFLNDFCTEIQILCLWENEAPASGYFLTKEDCEASIDCTVDEDCVRTVAAPNDCNMYFKPHMMDQAGTCTNAKCVYEEVAQERECSATELWLQNNKTMLFVGILLLIAIIYALWEKGPKRGFFRKRK